MKQTFNITSNCVMYHNATFNSSFDIRSNIYIPDKRIKLLPAYYDTVNNQVITREEAKELYNIENQSCVEYINNNINWIQTLPRGILFLMNQKEVPYLIFKIRNKTHIKSISKQENLKVYSKQGEIYNFDLNLWIPTETLFSVNLGDVFETYTVLEIDERLEKYNVVGLVNSKLLNYFKEYWSGKELICCSMERRGYTEPSYCTVKDLKKFKSERIHFNQDSRNFNIPVWNEDGGNEMEKWFIKKKLKNIFEL